MRAYGTSPVRPPIRSGRLIMRHSLGARIHLEHTGCSRRLRISRYMEAVLSRALRQGFVTRNDIKEFLVD